MSNSRNQCATLNLTSCKPSLTVVKSTYARAVRTNVVPPYSDGATNVVQDVPDRTRNKDVADEISQAIRRASKSTPCGISLEDLKPGLGHQVQGHSIVTFSTRMKDSVGATVDRFSYQLVSSRHFSQDLKLMMCSLHAHSNNAH